jgi:hypothetical protein
MKPAVFITPPLNVLSPRMSPGFPPRVAVPLKAASMAFAGTAIV